MLFKKRFRLKLCVWPIISCIMFLFFIISVQFTGDSATAMENEKKSKKSSESSSNAHTDMMKLWKISMEIHRAHHYNLINRARAHNFSLVYVCVCAENRHENAKVQQNTNPEKTCLLFFIEGNTKRRKRRKTRFYVLYCTALLSVSSDWIPCLVF